MKNLLIGTVAVCGGIYMAIGIAVATNNYNDLQTAKSWCRHIEIARSTGHDCKEIRKKYNIEAD